ncbi:PepSY domain-containing protein [Actinoplanes sp. TFC3]|uniref:PepSY domain-containing protein n=1 Tax=Actinoplanes sp. TFC3 TaxID=1710355 RepID=UPI00082C5F99|nr:PepSY domain-containing protein [Actinoplanes sp. TFC3]
MNKRAGVVVATGAFALFGVFGTAVMASASEVPAAQPVLASHGHDDSPSPSVSASASATPSEPSASPSLPSASPSLPSASPSAPPSAPVIISADQAKAIALAASGGGTITKFELKDERSDHPEYRVEITNGRTEHKIRINAFTGVITRHDVK